MGGLCILHFEYLTMSYLFSVTGCFKAVEAALMPSALSYSSLFCLADSLSATFSYLSSLLCTMIPAVFTTAMPEGSTVTQRCKASSPSPRFCRSKASKMFYCKICLSEYSNKKGQKLENCSCVFCKEVCIMFSFVLLIVPEC